MTVTLSSATGSSLIATSGGGVTVSGSGTNTLSLSGTVADINAFLASGSRPTFTASADFNGSTWITMLTSDNGGGTSGPVRTDRDVIAVSVSAAADAINNSVTTNEETPVTFAPLANDTYSGSRTITAINGTAITAGGSTVAVTGGNVGLDATGQLDTATAVEAGGNANGTAGTNPTGNVLTNDTDVDAGDTKTVSGVVAGTSASASGSVGTGVTGSFGSINIAADGAYTYTVDNTNATVQAFETTGQHAKRCLYLHDA
jgi:VCBS repeat-containing protein